MHFASSLLAFAGRFFSFVRPSLLHISSLSTSMSPDVYYWSLLKFTVYVQLTTCLHQRRGREGRSRDETTRQSFDWHGGLCGFYVSEADKCLGNLNYRLQGWRSGCQCPLPGPSDRYVLGEVIYHEDHLRLVFSNIFLAIAHFLCSKNPYRAT